MRVLDDEQFDAAAMGATDGFQAVDSATGDWSSGLEALGPGGVDEAEQEQIEEAAAELAMTRSSVTVPDDPDKVKLLKKLRAKGGGPALTVARALISAMPKVDTASGKLAVGTEQRHEKWLADQHRTPVFTTPRAAARAAAFKAKTTGWSNVENRTKALQVLARA